MQRKGLLNIPEPTFPLRKGQLCTERVSVPRRALQKGLKRLLAYS